MAYDFYSRTNQRILDGAIVAISFYASYLIRYDGAILPYYQYQFWALLMPLIAGRLIVNFLFGLDAIQWRYIGFRDAWLMGRAYVAFSSILLVARFVLPNQMEILRIPASVIVIELLLSLIGAMAIRLSRRHLYEVKSRDANEGKIPSQRRVLLIGAGVMGANAAKGLASDSSLEVIGFLDDDPHKFGCVIAGAKVLGSTSELTEVIRTKSGRGLGMYSPDGQGVI